VTDAERQDALEAAFRSPSQDPLERWRAFHAEREADRAQGRAELREREREILAARQAGATTQVWRCIEEAQAVLISALGEQIIAERQLWREQVAELEHRVTALEHKARGITDIR
jgi:hypothetical protein